MSNPSISFMDSRKSWKTMFEYLLENWDGTEKGLAKALKYSDVSGLWRMKKKFPDCSVTLRTKKAILKESSALHRRISGVKSGIENF